MNVATLLLFITLGALLPFYLISDVPAFKFDLSAAILYGALLYASARLAHLAHLGERRLLALTFWLFVYVWGLLSAVLQVGADVFPWQRHHTDAEQVRTAVLLVLALATFEAGGMLARRRERRNPSTQPWVFSLHSTLALGLGAIVVALLALENLGGISVALQSRGDVSAALWREGGSLAMRNIIEVLLRSAPFVACLTLLFVLQRRWRELNLRSRWLMLGVFLFVLPVTLITNYPDALSRGWLGTVTLSFGFLLVPWRRWTMSCVVVLLVGAFVFLFPHADRNRARSYAARVAPSQVTYQSPVIPLLIKGDYDVFVQFANAGIYVRERGHMNGRNLLGTTLFWLPRRWWPGKPLASGHEVALHVNNPFTNLSAPLWAEAYLAFGTLGIVLVMGTYGYLVGTMDQRYVRQIRMGVEWGLLRIFVPFWAGYQVYFLRGPLMHTVAFSALAVVLFMVLARLRKTPTSLLGTPRPLAPQASQKNALI